MKAKTDLTLNLLREFFELDKALGLLFWRVSRGRAKKGDVAGTLFPSGYYKVRINKAMYPVHRLIYMMANDVVLKTDEFVDHIDHDTKNNKPENLRALTQSQNCHNNLGKGYSHCKTTGKWLAQIMIYNRSIKLGRWDSEGAAIFASALAKRWLHDFNVVLTMDQMDERVAFVQDTLGLKPRLKFSELALQNKPKASDNVFLESFEETA